MAVPRFEPWQTGFPGGSSSKEPSCQCQRCRLDPWVMKIPWRRIWQPTPLFLPGESHRQRSLAGCSPSSHRVGLKWLSTCRLTLEPSLWYTSNHRQDMAELLGPPSHGPEKKRFILSIHTCWSLVLDQDLCWILVAIAIQLDPRPCYHGAFKAWFHFPVDKEGSVEPQRLTNPPQKVVKPQRLRLHPQPMKPPRHICVLWA